MQVREDSKMAVTIRDIRVICTAPEGINLVVVKVETSEPGLYGLGCGTFNLPPPGCKAGSRRIFEASSGWKKCRILKICGS